MSFANQFPSMVALAQEGTRRGNQVYPFSPRQDREIAAIKLSTMGISIDTLSAAQQDYRYDYAQGT